jgi:hypothetical protein
MNTQMPQPAVGVCRVHLLPQNTGSAGVFTSLRGLRTHSNNL